MDDGRTGIPALEAVAADGWRAVEQDRLGDWLLRASSGFTARGNSALTGGSPGLPLEQAVAVTEVWYAARHLPPRFALVTDAAGEPLVPELAARLEDRGYARRLPTLMMTATAAALPRLTVDSPPVLADTQLGLPWLTAFADYRPILPGVAEQILTGSRSQLFLSVAGDGDAPAAIARMSIYPGWAGIHAMWVDPARRRTGLATAMVAAVAKLAGENHMPEVYLLVERSNSVAVAAYSEMGFIPHHGQFYLVAGTGEDADRPAHA